MDTNNHHRTGRHTRILLCSVFGPYAQDDAFGSRAVNPMELYQNQVTRLQGAFSLRMFHRSFGLMMIQANIQAPCTLLDFPSQDRLTEEIREHDYDVIGISAILPNIDKVKRMCELIRLYRPQAQIVVGGHIAGKDDIRRRIDADHIVKGDGIRWFRKFLGEDEEAPIRHPAALSGFGGRILGIDLDGKPGDTAAILIPSVGCPMGCNFCSTSALFGGKGHFLNFYQTGDELFQVMTDIEAELQVRSFFVLDENFLLHRKRALRLLELMEAHDKDWALYVFSSARVLNSYTMDQLNGLGVSFVWMGLEGQASAYDKLASIDTKDLVAKLQTNGIRVLGSSIIGLENHTPEHMDGVIDYAVRHDTVFHQFMLYTPLPGTPLYEEHRRQGTLYDEGEVPLADTHGQSRFNYRHAHISRGREEFFLLEAFRRDFDINGPSLARMIRVMLNGWLCHKNNPDRRIRRRITWETAPLRTTYAGAVWAMRAWYRGRDESMAAKMDRLLDDLCRSFGWKTKILASLIGPYAYWLLKREDRRLASGWSYEPTCVYEKNAAARALENKDPVPAGFTAPQKAHLAPRVIPAS